jgi:hypothetical protein
MSKGVNSVVRLLFRMQVRDASGGFRCYRVSKLRQTMLDGFWSRGYSFQQEMLYRCHLAGCRLGETPIIFDNRKFGKSKVSPKEAARSLSTILCIGLHSIFGLDKPMAALARRKGDAADAALFSSSWLAATLRAGFARNPIQRRRARCNRKRLHPFFFSGARREVFSIAFSRLGLFCAFGF